MKKKYGMFLSAMLACSLALSACGQSGAKETTAASAAPESSAEAKPAETITEAEKEAKEAPVSEEPVYVYLTRHGETLTNRTARMVSGRGNAPLTEEGRQVASTVGVGLSGIKFAAAYSSPLGRTEETAQLILEQSQTSWDLPVTPVEGLRELDGGSFEPMGYGELGEKYGMNFAAASVEEFQNQFYEKDERKLAETYDQAVERAVTAFEEICEETAKNGGGNVLVVAHGGINGLIASEIMGKKDLEALENSSVVLIEYKDGKYQVLSFNDLSYGENAKAKMENPEPVELYLMVNAETVTEEQGRLSGVLDTELTEAGLAQAKETGKKLGEVEFASVYTSDQHKDRNTAMAVIGESAVNPHLREHTKKELRGVACGYFDGELLEVTNQIAAKEGSAKERVAAYAEADPLQMVEDYETAKERLLGAVEEIRESQNAVGGGNVLVVTSELACKLIAEELGAEPKELAPGEIVKIRFEGENCQVSYEE